MAGTKDGQRGQGTVKGNSSWRGNREGQGAGWKGGSRSRERHGEQGEGAGDGGREQGAERTRKSGAVASDIPERPTQDPGQEASLTGSSRSPFQRDTTHFLKCKLPSLKEPRGDRCHAGLLEVSQV